MLLDENYSSYRMIADQMKGMGYAMEDFNVSYHLDTTESVKSMVIGKNGLTFLPYMAVKKGNLSAAAQRLLIPRIFVCGMTFPLYISIEAENNNYQTDHSEEIL